MQRAQLKAQAKSKKPHHTSTTKPATKKTTKKVVTTKKRTMVTTKKRTPAGLPALAPPSFTSLTTNPSSTTSLVAPQINSVLTNSRRGVKCNADELRSGSLLKMGDEGKLFKVLKVEKKMMGRRPTSLSLDLKCLATGKNIPLRLMPADTVDRVELDLKYLLFLYTDGEIGHIMNQETFDQIEFPADMLGDVAKWLPPDIKLQCHFYNGELFSIQPPDNVVWEVEREDNDLNSRTPIANFKNMYLANGEKLAVPEFIKVGDKVRVKLEDYSFMTRFTE